MLFRVILFILISAGVFLPLYFILTKRYRPTYSLADRLLATFILGISQIIITEIVLGLALRLTVLNLSVLNVVIAAGVLITSGIGPADISRQWGEVRVITSNFLRTVYSNKILLVIFVLFVLQILWWTFLVYLFPPYDWDGLDYHLPKAIFILQSQGIEVFKAGYAYINGYPFNSELLLLWNVIFLRNDILVEGTQIMFALGAVLAIYSLGRKAGIRPAAALYAMIFLFVPIVIQQATSNYNDIILSSLLIIAVNFLLLKNVTGLNLMVLGLTVGLTVGSKYNFILPGLIISLVLIYLLFGDYSRGKNIKNHVDTIFRSRLIRDVIIFLVPVLITGGFWYIRNYVLYDNPLSPVQVTVLGQVLFPGPQTPADNSLGNPVLTNPIVIINAWLERSAPMWNNSTYNFDVGRGGFGPMFPVLFLPAILFSIFIALKKKKKYYLLISLIFILSFLAIPENWLSRYTIFFCEFGVLAFITIIGYLPHRQMITLITIPIIILSFVLGNYSAYFTPGEIARLLHKPLSERRSIDFPVFFEKYKGLYETVSTQAGSTVLYTDWPDAFIYPLWNSDYTNQVFNIPKQYGSFDEFILEINKYGKSQIVTTGDSDVIAFYKADESSFQVQYHQDNFWVVTCTGGDNVQK